ncbi:MAG: hypothetical protein ACU84J_03255 [Gammaproteobacteria bacterium]
MPYRAVIFSVFVLLWSSWSVNAESNKSDPKALFDFTLTYAIEQKLPSFVPFDMLNPDPTFSLLRDEVGMSEEEIAQMASDAEAFYLERFGLDFTNVEADSDGIKWIDGAIMFSYRFGSNIDYRVISAGNANLKTNPKIIDGGFIVMTTDSVMYHGTFGGEAGKQGFPGEMLPYALYQINHLVGPNSKPLVIYARAAGPMRTNVDGDTSINCEVIHPTLGRGNAEGVFKVIPNPDGSVQLSARNVLTFPAR